ncbi:hypothetical protein ES703_120551 [subsurface metagenome]
MKIQTDFTPKPGDRVRHRSPSGQVVVCVFVTCPDCSEGRWVPNYFFIRPGFTGRCKECNIAHAKKEGWASL